MTSAASVGVVIATRNRAARLATALHALAELPERPEVVVVDNGSTDGTADLVAERFPGVRLLRLTRNHGAVARTYGARELDTPYVAFCDDDSGWEPGALGRAADLLKAHPRLGVVAARVRVGADGREDPLNAVLAASPLGPAEGPPGTRVLGFLACAAVVRRRAFLEAGGFHPVLFFGAEETLLAYDLCTRGWEVAYCPEVVARHHPGAEERGGRSALMRRNELLTVWLRRPWPLAVRRTAALALEARRDVAARAALRGALARLPATLRRREVLPPEVEAAARRVELPAAGPGRRSSHA
jgi:GT2 family glycosyltransferase